MDPHHAFLVVHPHLTCVRASKGSSSSRRLDQRHVHFLRKGQEEEKEKQQVEKKKTEENSGTEIAVL